MRGAAAGDLRRGRRQRRPARRRARRARRRRRRPRRHVLLEHPGAPRGVLRDPVHGRGAAHAQHPPVPRAARLRRQPRRGPDRHRRRLAGPAARDASSTSSQTVETFIVVGDGDASRARRPATGAALRRAPRRRAARASTSPRSTSGRRGDVLHERHHRQPEGCRLLAPLDVPALARRDARRPRSGSPSATACSRSCRCSTPTRGACRTRRGCAARRSLMPGPLPAGRAAGHDDRGRAADVLRRGADDLGRHLSATATSTTIDLSSLRMVVCGGSAVPRALMERFEERYGVPHRPGLGHDRDEPARRGRRTRRPRVELGPPEEIDWRAKTGRVVAGVELRIVDDDGDVLPWDGEAVGEIEVRGPWITAVVLPRPRAREVRRRLAAHRRRRHGERQRASSRSPTAPRTSSSRAASGSPRSSSRTT